MGWEPIKCYLCGKDAEQWNYDPRDLRLRPALSSEEACECGFYMITSGVITYRMDRQKKTLVSKEGKPLTDKQKRYLIDYVKKNQDPTEKELVKIDLSTFDIFTQKSLKPG